MDWQAKADAAAGLISRFGQPATLRRAGAPVYDPATGEATATEQTADAWAVTLAYDARRIDGTLIQAGDREVLLSVPAFAPEPGDVIACGVDLLRVVRSDALAPAGVPLLYTVQGRSA